jgi:hypothetical protein
MLKWKRKHSKLQFIFNPCFKKYNYRKIADSGSTTSDDEMDYWNSELPAEDQVLLAEQ